MLSTACSEVVYRDRYVERTLPPIPAEPMLYEVEWHMGQRFAVANENERWYCVNELGAKSLIKDIYLMQTHIQELRDVFSSLTTMTEGAK